MNKQLAQIHFKYCEQTIELKSSLELGYLDLAQRLWKISERRMFEPNYESFEEFLMDIKISRATANKLMNIWHRFIHEFGIKPKLLADAGGWSIVAEVLPYARNKSEAEDWLLLAKSNSRNDLRKHLIEAKTGIIMVNCRHADEEEITFYKCRKCGETRRKYPDEKD